MFWSVDWVKFWKLDKDTSILAGLWIILLVTHRGFITEHTYNLISHLPGDYWRSLTFKFFLSSRIDKCNYRCDCLDQLQWSNESTKHGFHFRFWKGGYRSMRSFSERKMFKNNRNFRMEGDNLFSSVPPRKPYTTISHYLFTLFSFQTIVPCSCVCSG